MGVCRNIRPISIQGYIIYQGNTMIRAIERSGDQPMAPIGTNS